MKKFLWLWFLLQPGLSMAQQKFSVSGQVGHFDAPARLYLRYAKDTTTVEDSALLSNGFFEFIGDIKYPTQAMLLLAPGTRKTFSDRLMLYLNPGKVKVFSTDSLKKAKVTGSESTNDHLRLQDKLREVEAKLLAVYKSVEELTVDQFKADSVFIPYMRKLKKVMEERKQVLKEFILENPASFVSLYALKDYGGAVPQYHDVNPLFETLAPILKKSDVGKSLKTSLDRLKHVAIGKVAPDFTQNTPDGTPIKLSAFRGKYVLIEFWASWCLPCRIENPRLVRVYEKFRHKNFEILGVSLDKAADKSKWIKAISDDKLQWQHVSDLYHFKNAAAEKYGVIGVPQNFLINPEGIIIASDLRAEELEELLSKMLK